MFMGLYWLMFASGVSVGLLLAAGIAAAFATRK